MLLRNIVGNIVLCVFGVASALKVEGFYFYFDHCFPIMSTVRPRSLEPFFMLFFHIQDKTRDMSVWDKLNRLLRAVFLHTIFPFPKEVRRMQVLVV